MSRLAEAARGGRRVWSLLEIMRHFSAASLILTHNIADHFARSHSKPGSRLWSIVDFFHRDGLPLNDRAVIRNVDRANYEAMLRDWTEEFAGLEMPASAITARKMRKALENDKCRYADLHEYGQELQDRMLDELRGRFFLSLSLREASIYSAPQRGWEQVISRFPGATSDVEEAVKCFALGRYTATAFHLMRVVEAGIRKLSDVLDARVSPNAGWQKVLNDGLEPAINALPDRTPAEKARKTDLQQARAHLHAIRLGWRNDTMHPKATYTEEEAEALIGHVGTFMRHLATRLSAEAEV